MQRASSRTWKSHPLVILLGLRADEKGVSLHSEKSLSADVAVEPPADGAKSVSSYSQKSSTHKSQDRTRHHCLPTAFSSLLSLLVQIGSPQAPNSHLLLFRVFSSLLLMQRVFRHASKSLLLLREFSLPMPRAFHHSP